MLLIHFPVTPLIMILHPPTSSLLIGVVTTIVDVPLPPGSSSSVPTMLIDDSHGGTDSDHKDGDSSLLPFPAGDVSINSSNCRRDGRSRVPLGVPSMSRRSPPPPTAVEGGAARRGVGRPAARVASDASTSPPRPGPASLLSSIQCPQQGHATNGAGRAGHSRGARGTGVSDAPDHDAGLVQGPARARRSAKQATGAARFLHLPTMGNGEIFVGVALAAAGLRVARRVIDSQRAVNEQDEDKSGKKP